MKQHKLSFAILTMDLMWSVVAISLALILRYGWHLNHVGALSTWFPFLVATWIIWTVFSLATALDGFRGGWRLSAVVSQLVLAVAGLMLIVFSGGYLFRSYVSRLALAEFGVLLFGGFLANRIFAYVLVHARSRNGSVRRVVIVGRGRLARELARKIQKHPEMLFKVVGFLSSDGAVIDSDALAGCATSTLSIGVTGIADLLCKERTDEVILATQEYSSPDLLNLAAACRERSITVSVIPQFYELYLSRFQVVDFDGLPVLQLSRAAHHRSLAWKRAFDVAGALALMTVAVPVVLPLAIALKLRRGSAFRRETRCGLKGKQFSMLRLNVNREQPSVSLFDGLLLKLSITELPQLWNVVCGQMSLVGPRPEAPERVFRYSEWQQQRLAVRPGITGLAQVHGLREQHSSEEKTRLDLQYLLHSSVWTDLSLLLQTIWTLATRTKPLKMPAATFEIEAPLRQRRPQEILENA